MALPSESDDSTPFRPGVWRVGLLVAYWLVLLTATHWPKEIELGVPVTSYDKVQHLVAFGTLAWLLAWCMYANQRFTLRRAAAVVAIVALYGLFDEVTQPWFNRTFDPFDLVADVIGAAIGLGVYAVCERRWGCDQL
ncbi:VanZ family protein [Aeoliella sp. ICT_H6.2]|uniref:VanZ family protein n=1 Tax=Aeoliella straminimaris TaxID=2954799 RepID=A0A9X2FA79_9BACT|nr:VanZ family protein [Aeoliella straminimaris]MCO6042559.1 VanZ family protein [Aeoliella straminimaris]